jgi:phosphoglycerol transferase MdoB-like AlkP superfamily enzyme
MYVNAVGGGTWITEFETITGIDSRLFGYSGHYTHSSLSPYVNETFVTYLKKHGYVTEAFYATRGNFYNAANAYKNYGFDAFFEKVGLNSWVTKDEDLIDTVIELSNTEQKPFFKYIVTIGNHYTTKCENFSSKEQFVTTFKDNNEFNNANCILNEYISGLKSTEQAFLKLVKYLEELEKSTGRPFVLLIYGDHQPTILFYPHLKFRQFRTTENQLETFFHLVSSIPNVVKCCGETAPHATLMPTLLSAYVASDIDDLYLNINLFSFKNCGSDFMTGNFSSGGYGVDFKAPPQTKKCSIYEQLLTAYRNSGVLNNF